MCGIIVWASAEFSHIAPSAHFPLTYAGARRSPRNFTLINSSVPPAVTTDKLALLLLATAEKRNSINFKNNKAISMVNLLKVMILNVHLFEKKGSPYPCKAILK